MAAYSIQWFVTPIVLAGWKKQHDSVLPLTWRGLLLEIIWASFGDTVLYSTFPRNDETKETCWQQKMTWIFSACKKLTICIRLKIGEDLLLSYPVACCTSPFSPQHPWHPGCSTSHIHCFAATRSNSCSRRTPRVNWIPFGVPQAHSLQEFSRRLIAHWGPVLDARWWSQGYIPAPAHLDFKKQHTNWWYKRDDKTARHLGLLSDFHISTWNRELDIGEPVNHPSVIPKNSSGSWGTNHSVKYLKCFGHTQILGGNGRVTGKTPETLTLDTITRSRT